LALLQVPPAVVVLNADVSPVQIVVLPVIAAGNPFTVITIVWLQPEPDE
jgi:hypothetical protein